MANINPQLLRIWQQAPLRLQLASPAEASSLRQKLYATRKALEADAYDDIFHRIKDYQIRLRGTELEILDYNAMLARVLDRQGVSAPPEPPPLDEDL
jgi:hypothetical protein